MNHRDTENTEKYTNALTEKVIGAALDVHRTIVPGLLESAYRQCLCHELNQLGMETRQEVALPVTYKGVHLECGYRLDIVVS